MRFLRLSKALMIASAKKDEVFWERISSYSINISFETQNSILPERNSVHTLWYGLAEGKIASRQFVSITMRLILLPHKVYANVR